MKPLRRLIVGQAVGEEKMKRTIYKAVAFTCIVIGFGGIAGAVEHGSGMAVSVLMLCTGAAVLHGIYRKEEQRK